MVKIKKKLGKYEIVLVFFFKKWNNKKKTGKIRLKIEGLVEKRKRKKRGASLFIYEQWKLLTDSHFFWYKSNLVILLQFQN